MAFFGGVWLLSSAVGQRHEYVALVAGVAAVVTAFLIFSSVRYARDNGTNAGQSQDSQSNRSQGRGFLAIVGLEIVSINVAVVALFALHKPEYVVPAIATIVGLHFLPLARVFAFAPYYVTGAVLTMVGVIAGVTLWNAVACIVCAIALWVTSAIALQPAR